MVMSVRAFERGGLYDVVARGRVKGKRTRRVVRTGVSPQDMPKVLAELEKELESLLAAT